MTLQSLGQLIDHTNLKANATQDDLKKLCSEAIEYNLKMIAINSFPVAFCSQQLQDSLVHVGAAIGFPLGQTSIETKVFETTNAIENGAHEIDYVINIGMLKDKEWKYIEHEMHAIIDICKNHQVITKVIYENCYLTDDEKKKLSDIALKIKPDFIKTSTGLGVSGAKIKDVSLMKSCVGNEIKVKASGGIKTLDELISFVNVGAERIGTSASVSILKEWKKQNH